MTPTELYNQIRNLAFDVNTKLSGETELYQYMSDAELEIAKKVYCTQNSTTENSVIDQREYDRPSGALKIERITWNTVKLKKINIGDIDVAEGQSYGGTTSTGNVVYYYEYGSKIGLSPVPTEVKEIKYYYLKYPTVLNASSTAFTIPEEYVHYISDYCLYRMFLKDDQKGLADRSFKIWLDNLVRCEEDWADRGAIDMIQQVRLEEIYPDSELGMI